MAKVFNHPYTREDLLQRVGDISQFAGVRVAELSDGFERGIRIADIRTGSGFDFTVLIDRGLDIGWATFQGASLAWRSPTTVVGPAFFEPEGKVWLRGFHGGLVTTCGLTYFGAPCTDDGKDLGLHGRASFTPATHFGYGGNWEGDEYDIWVTAQVREASVFGENLVLKRRVASRLGTSKLSIEDCVTNEGFQSAPLMLLYHVNLGFPVIDEQSELLSVSMNVKPRDQAAAAGIGQYNRFQAPTRGYEEQVFYHTMKTDSEGYAKAAVVNRAYHESRGLGVYLRYRAAELPYLVQWKMMGHGQYVCGLEPSTNLVEGRAKERKEGRLQFLEPGESRSYKLEIGVLGSQSEIEAFTASLDHLSA